MAMRLSETGEEVKKQSDLYKQGSKLPYSKRYQQRNTPKESKFIDRDLDIFRRHTLARTSFTLCTYGMTMVDTQITRRRMSAWVHVLHLELKAERMNKAVSTNFKLSSCVYQRPDLRDCLPLNKAVQQIYFATIFSSSPIIVIRYYNRSSVRQCYDHVIGRLLRINYRELQQSIWNQQVVCAYVEVLHSSLFIVCDPLEVFMVDFVFECFRR